MRSQLLSHSHNHGSYHKRKSKYIFHFCQDVGSILQLSNFNQQQIYLIGWVLLVCHPLFQMCANSSDIPCQAVPLCFSSCTVKSISHCTVSSTPLIPTQYLLQLSLSTAVCHSISRTRLQEASSLQQAKCQAKLSHAKYYPLSQDSYNTLFKRNLFPLASVPKARDTHAKVLL